MRDVVLIAVVFVLAFIALRRPVVGMLTFVWLGFFNPHSMTWGIGRTFPFSQLVGITTIIGYLVFWSEPKRLPLQRESLLLLALWGMFAISSFFAFYPQEAFQEFIFISKILLMVFLCTSLINTEQRLHWLLRVIALSLGLYGLKSGIFAIASGGQFMVWGPERSFLYANNAIGLALAMNIPLLVYLGKTETRRWLRWVMRAMLGFSYPAIICTFSRGAWLGLAIVTALIILKSRHKFLFLSAAGILGFMLLPFLPQLLPQRVLDRYSELVNYEQESSAQSRFWAWEFCQRVGLDRPLVGGGFQFDTREAYERYFPEFFERYPEFRRVAPQETIRSCHSTWYIVFAEHGFPGLILWVGLMVSYLFSLRQLRAYAKAHPEMASLADYADMLQTALAAFMITGTFLDIAHFDMFYYLVAILIIIKERLRLGEIASSSPATVSGITRSVVGGRIVEVRSP